MKGLIRSVVKDQVVVGAATARGSAKSRRMKW